MPKECHLVKGGYKGRFFAKPELKFFFIRLIYRYEINEIRELSVNELANGLGVSKNTVVEGMLLLCQIGFYSKSLGKVDSSYTKGRPTCVYIPTDTLKELLQRETSECYWKVLIDDLLDDCGKKNDESRRHSLKLANRLLLVVLLFHADKGAQVCNLGYSQLNKLTGMSKQQLASQRKTLSRLDYIKGYEPGSLENTEQNFTHRKSTYSINTGLTRYPAITRMPPKSLFLRHWEVNPFMLLELAGAIETAKRNVSLRLCGDSTISEKSLAKVEYLDICSEFSSLIGYKNAWMCSGFYYENFRAKQKFEALNLKLVSYASLMLKQHWKQFSKRSLQCSELAIADNLKYKINDDFLLGSMSVPQKLQPLDVKLSGQEMSAVICETVLCLSFGLARLVYKDLIEFADYKPEDTISVLTISPMKYLSATMHAPIEVQLVEK
ncbi:hypothetical protein [Shewanella sp. Isolate11]|uniref:hypothetical protein n=1 Tax=Shewanella sp. Isolate11 TaxID=2908530 RepID=UPI001EFCD6C9|nr:hypothetical protein [Shewanella sp. Isolate11]MCG9698027.1 hypothetical protein [Shewanella sp. Isolate11]